MPPVRDVIEALACGVAPKDDVLIAPGCVLTGGYTTPMKLPRHAEIWLPGYVAGRLEAIRSSQPGPQRLWLTVTDHYEPFWRNTDEHVARERVMAWLEHWPQIARRHLDSDSRPARYSFFYPEEEYRPKLIDSLALLRRQDLADIEIHLHHNHECRDRFLERMNGFIATLRHTHGLLHEQNGRAVFGFIHGNWALDNSRPDGEWCGLSDEITLLARLGCYADFTMPSGASPTQCRLVNQIYWARDDPSQPKSYDTGTPLTPGGGIEGDLLMITGPLGIRWGERLLPRLEAAEIAANNIPTPYRVRRWVDIAPRVGRDVFIKLHTHGAQDRNLRALLEGGLDQMYSLVASECTRRSIEYRFVTAWEMYCAIEALRCQRDPVSAVGEVVL